MCRNGSSWTNFDLISILILILLCSQKATITDLEKRVEEERELRKEENAEAQAALKAAVEKARKEAAEERKQQAEAAAKLQKQLEDKISELQVALPDYLAVCRLHFGLFCICGTFKCVAFCRRWTRKIAEEMTT